MNKLLATTSSKKMHRFSGANSSASSFSWTPRNKILLLLVGVIVVIAVIAFQLFSSDLDSIATEMVNQNYPRLELYCAKKQHLGAENSYFTGKEDFQLKKLVFTIRHGDRSSIHLIPNSKINVPKPLRHLDPDVLKYTKHLSAISMEVLGVPVEKIVSFIFFGAFDLFK
jgi:hypothetical protein